MKTTPTIVTRRLGYVRLSHHDNDSLSVENQRAALLAIDPKMPIWVDDGVSGAKNLTDPNSKWQQLWRELQRDPKGTQVCVISIDRIGRKKGKVLSVVEDIIDGGGSILTIKDGKVYDDLRDNAQDLTMLFQTYSDEQYRVQVGDKTRAALNTLQSAGIQLGRKPSLTNKDVAAMKELHERGLGYTAIGKVVRTQRTTGKDKGKWFNTSPKVVRAVINGHYTTREEWETHNARQREKLLHSITTEGDEQ